MKRLIPVVLLTVLVLAACGDILTSSQMDMAIQTLTATVLPPAPTATPAPDESSIVLLINRGLAETADPLAQVIDTRYQVVEATFLPGADGQLTTFRIDVRCECNGAGCCSPTHTFVVITHAMKASAEKIARQVPLTVTDVQVVCSDQTTQVGMAVVAWRDWLDYFRGAINGFQLGGRVVTLAAP